MICKNCGKEIENGHIMCLNCGALVNYSTGVTGSINWGEPVNVPAPAQTSAPVDQEYQKEQATQKEKSPQIEEQVLVEPGKEIAQRKLVAVLKQIYITKQEALIAQEKARIERNKIEYNRPTIFQDEPTPQRTTRQVTTPSKPRKTNRFIGRFEAMTDGEKMVAIIKFMLVLIMGILSYLAAKDKEYHSYEQSKKRWDVIDKAIEDYEPETSIPDDYYKLFDNGDTLEGYGIYEEIFKDANPEDMEDPLELESGEDEKSEQAENAEEDESSEEAENSEEADISEEDENN